MLIDCACMRVRDHHPVRLTVVVVVSIVACHRVQVRDNHDGDASGVELLKRQRPSITASTVSYDSVVNLTSNCHQRNFRWLTDSMLTESCRQLCQLTPRLTLSEHQVMLINNCRHSIRYHSEKLRVENTLPGPKYPKYTP